MDPSASPITRPRSLSQSAKDKARGVIHKTASWVGRRINRIDKNEVEKIFTSCLSANSIIETKVETSINKLKGGAISALDTLKSSRKEAEDNFCTSLRTLIVKETFSRKNIRDEVCLNDRLPSSIKEHLKFIEAKRKLQEISNKANQAYLEHVHKKYASVNQFNLQKVEPTNQKYWKRAEEIINHLREIDLTNPMLVDNKTLYAEKIKSFREEFYKLKMLANQLKEKNTRFEKIAQKINEKSKDEQVLLKSQNRISEYCEFFKKLVESFFDLNSKTNYEKAVRYLDIINGEENSHNDKEIESKKLELLIKQEQDKIPAEVKSLDLGKLDLEMLTIHFSENDCKWKKDDIEFAEKYLFSTLKYIRKRSSIQERFKELPSFGAKGGKQEI